MSIRRFLPWLERNGRLSPLKLVVFVALLVPAAITAFELATGALQPRPITEVIHQLGLWAVRLLFLSLFITPARQIFRWPRLLIVRRMIGVAAFAYAFAHVCFYVVDQSFDLLKVASEIVLRIYLTIGFVALTGLAALAATSTDAMVRRLGAARWRKLHRITYVIAVLATIHFFLQVKANVAEPTLMAGLLGWLFLYRLSSRMNAGWHPGVAMMFVLALAAGVGTALGEALYYTLARGADPFRVLASDLSLRFGPRPAVSVLAACLAVAIVALIRRPRSGPAGSST